MKTLPYKISVPTDNGFWGRSCANCKKYFKINHEWIKDELYCPYCGELQENINLWTKQQTAAVDKIAKKIALRHAEELIEKALKNAFKGSKSITYTPGTKTRIPTLKKHLEREVDTEIECIKCSTPFQVSGIFGYCPGCREDNIIIYETNLEILLHGIENSNDPQRELRHNYNDLVSTFEIYCKSISNKFGLGNTNFQNLEAAIKLFQKHDLNILTGVNESQYLNIRRVFEKRHAYQHSKGKINQKYIEHIPEDISLLNSIAALSKDEFIEGIEILKGILKNITNKYGN